MRGNAQGGPDPRGSRLGQRLRYRFDNLLSRGTWATLVWLGILTFGVVAISAVALALFDVGLSGSQDTSYLEDFWQSLLRVLDTGTMAADVGWGRRVLALLITLFGVMVAGTLIGVIAAGVGDRIEHMRRGRSVVFESGHVVVLGSSDRLPTLVRQLALARAQRRESVIVVMANRDPAEMQDAVRRTVPDMHGSRLVFRSGDPTHPSDLALVSLEQSEVVIVLADRDGGDARAIRTVIGVVGELGGNASVPTVVELSDADSAARLSRVYPEGVHPIVPSLALARVASVELREPGIGHVAIALLDDKASDVHISDAPTLQGWRFGAIRDAYVGARPIGIFRSDGSTELNPPPDSRLEAGDRLVLVSESKIEIPDPTGVEEEIPVADPITVRTAQSDQHLLVLGWSDIGEVMLKDWAKTASRSSTAEVILDPDTFGADEIRLPGGLEARVEVTMSGDPAEALERLESSPRIDTILILAPLAQLGAEQADSRTLLGLVGLRRVLGTLAGPSPRVIVELADSENVPLAQLAHVDDFVISDAIGSQLIAQLAEQPESRGVFLALYDADGPSLHLVRAGQLGLTDEIGMADMYRAAYRAGMLAIGFRRSGGELVLNPLPSERFTFDVDDQIIVIA